MFLDAHAIPTVDTMLDTQPPRHHRTARRVALPILALLVTAACASTTNTSAGSQPSTSTPTPCQSTPIPRESTISATPQPTTKETDPMTTIRITVADQTITAELNDNPPPKTSPGSSR